MLMDKRVEIVEDEHLPVTTSIYKCSNQECQEASEKKQAERTKKHVEQEAAKQARMEKMQANRRRKVEVKEELDVSPIV